MPFPIRAPSDYKKIAKESYMLNVRAQAAVRMVATACAGIPWIAYRDENELDKHQILDLIKRPNEYQSQSSFIEEMVSYLMLWGNDFVEGEFPRTPGRPPVHLYNIRPAYMSVKPGDGKKVNVYEFRYGTDKHEYTPEEMMHIKLFHPDNDFWGMGLAEAAALSIDQNNLSKMWNINLMKNGAKVGGLLSSETSLGEEEVKDLREQIKMQYGAENIGFPMVLEGNFDWKPMSLNAQDMDWLEGQKMSAREIALAFSVPPELLGDTETKTYSNYQESRKAFYMESVLPLMDKIRDELNGWLCPKWPGQNLRLDYDMDAIDALKDSRSDTWSDAILAVKAGIITPNEARGLLQFDPLPGGDELRTQPDTVLNIGNENQRNRNQEDIDEESLARLRQRVATKKNLSRGNR
jgi:HK97 family phage portal protein